MFHSTSTERGSSSIGQHTPGPWRAASDWVFGSHDVHANIVCNAPDDDTQSYERHWPANKHLIAAAPAYKWLFTELSEELRDYALTEAPEWVRAAIAKAEGKVER